jgi:hypothetical protein
MQRLRRVLRDLRNRRHVEVYAVVGASIVLAVLSLFGDLVGEEVRWAEDPGGEGRTSWRPRPIDPTCG